MGIENMIPGLVCLFVAYITAFLISKLHKTDAVASRNQSIDGLRGYLSLLVFLCHSVVWYYFIRVGEWREPPSVLYLHYGITSVIYFFMITSYLFWSKLFRAKPGGTNWSQLYISRILRLGPLYAFMVLIVLVAVAFLSNFTIHEPAGKLIGEIIRWLSFGILGSPNINGITNTSIMIAQVNWSLPYEWMFYFSLPASALLLGLKPRLITTCIFSLISVLVFYKANLNLFFVAAFLGGIASAYLVRYEPLVQFASKRLSSFIFVLSLVGGILTYEHARYVYLIFISISFFFIASGNNLFGLLASKASHILGQMGYSIYLLHGFLLYTTFTFVLDIEKVRAISPSQYWVIITALTPVLVIVSHFAYLFIEKPFMNLIAKNIQLKHLLKLNESGSLKQGNR